MSVTLPMSWKNRIQNILLLQRDWDSLSNKELIHLRGSALWWRNWALIALSLYLIWLAVAVFSFGLSYTLDRLSPPRHSFVTLIREHFIGLTALVIAVPQHLKLQQIDKITHDRMWGDHKTDDANP
ncbi:hypothetical protein [Aliiroseovarius crassostreae]|nr:hypothetical protein [Aliiroseovarius crassostreae]